MQQLIEGVQFLEDKGLLVWRLLISWRSPFVESSYSTVRLRAQALKRG